MSGVDSHVTLDDSAQGWLGAGSLHCRPGPPNTAADESPVVPSGILPGIAAYLALCPSHRIAQA